MQKRRKSRQYEQFFDVPEPSQPLIGFSAIAEHHYRSAVELLRQAENVCAGREWKVCFYVLSAICLFHASLECYINEELAVSLALLDKPPDHLVARCLALQDKTFSTEKLDGFLDAYGFREQFETAIIEDVTCLCNLRDRLYHHSPEMKPTNQYPEAAAVVLRKVGAAPINTSWTAAVSHLDVGEWARAVTQRFVETHCAAKGWPSLFSGRSPAWNSDHDLPQR